MARHAGIFMAIAFVVALLFLVSARISGFFKSQSLGSGASGSKEKQDAVRETRSRSKSIGTSHDSPEVTPANDPELEPVLSRLKLLERDRYTFCREWENEEEIVNEFILKKPTEAELKEINETISAAKGLTFNEDHFVVSWQQNLRDDFLFSSNESDQFIVSITFEKNSKRGHYAIVGVPKGGLEMRKGNAPFCANPIFLKAGVGFSFGPDWRFSHLLHLE
jgi:hypothetical protein